MLQFTIFITAIITVYSSVSYWLYLKLSMILFYKNGNLKYRNLFKTVYILFVLLYPMGKILSRTTESTIADYMIISGGFWFSFMFYGFLFCVFIEIVKLLLLKFTKSTKEYTHHVEVILLKNTAVLVFLIVIAGHLNVLLPKVTTVNITINKPQNKLDSLNIVMISDVHLGNAIGNYRFGKITEKIRSLNPDIILIAGDMVDDRIEPIIKANVGGLFNTLKPKYGIYAINGNHELFGDAKATHNYFGKYGVKYLTDQIVMPDSLFYIIGREDKSITRKGLERVQISAFMQNINQNYPVILLDHQPFEISKAISSNIDIKLSGHTHNGQLWPANFITKLIYEVNWGYKKVNNTNIYVSCGVGEWGPPVRTGSVPEIVNLKVRFLNKGNK